MPATITDSFTARPKYGSTQRMGFLGADNVCHNLTRSFQTFDVQARQADYGWPRLSWIVPRAVPVIPSSEDLTRVEGWYRNIS